MLLGLILGFYFGVTLLTFVPIARHLADKHKQRWPSLPIEYGEIMFETTMITLFWPISVISWLVGRGLRKLGHLVIDGRSKNKEKVERAS